MTERPQPMPPELYANPYAAGAITMSMIVAGVRGVLARIRRSREVRMLGRIDVLPPGWDAAGRRCTYR